MSQDINDRKQKRDDLEEKEADGARETKAMEQDIYGTERRPVRRIAQRHLVEGGEVREDRGRSQGALNLRRGVYILHRCQWEATERL